MVVTGGGGVVGVGGVGHVGFEAVQERVVGE